MYKFLVQLIFLLFLSNYCNQVDTATSKPAKDTARHQNGTVANFPYGDEAVMDCNMKDSSTNLAICSADQDSLEFDGKCPFSFNNNDSAIDPYITGPDSLFAPVDEILFSSNGVATPTVQCKKCDLRLTTDKDAVIVECFACYEIPTKGRTSRIEKNLLYKVYYLQVANYTSVDLTGEDVI